MMESWIISSIFFEQQITIIVVGIYCHTTLAVITLDFLFTFIVADMSCQATWTVGITSFSQGLSSLHCHSLNFIASVFVI